MQHFMHIHPAQAGKEGAFTPEQLVQMAPTPQSKALTALPCPVCQVPIPVPDGLTLGGFLARETAGKSGLLLSFQLKHQ
jgi:hypothetical protein